MLRQGVELDASSLSDVGIGVWRSGDRQHHIAFIYESSDGIVLLSHLLWHKIFRGKDPWDPKYFWVTLSSILDNTNREFFSSWLESLSTTPIDVSYGFDDRGCTFVKSQSGEITFENETPGKGLTCATFIIVALESIGFTPLEREQWPSRPDDREWQEEILEQLKPRMSANEFDLLSLDIGSVRYRPLEVVAACCLDDPWPIGFVKASEHADQILTDVAALRFVPKN